MSRPRHSRLAHIRAHELRMQLTISEARVWDAIKAKKAGARFRRQVPVGYWIPDFACLNPQLVVEIDDLSHDWSDETERIQYFESQGFTVLRFTNEEVAKEFPEVIGTIENWV
ncbi:MAG TPA: DUF559 domain-containing protein, partial [Actinobacteria bacterium]|nr:DUF559 domain-containing protein [Actinomycetota bacterium]